jgi:GNAT superfamily N-acetyltransferase
VAEAEKTMQCELAETDAEIADCFRACAELRPHIAEHDFLPRILRQQQAGYKLACLRDADEVQAVAGFRIGESLAWGRYMYIDDLVSRSTVRSQGYGQALFDWLIEFARNHMCTAIHLDSGVQNFDAHRFYLRNRMAITSHHFKLVLKD